uniref:HAT C-terminal dimerisation domain-containing protein n=1 Tax=Globodera rostochiensis TaxID=31243 RepID=A0A914H9A0_GLORO
MKKHPAQLDELEEKEKADAAAKEKRSSSQMSLKRMFSDATTSAQICPKFSRSASALINSQPQIDKTFNQWSRTGEMTMKADAALCGLICTAGLPFQFVEEPGFHNLCKIISPRYKPKGRKFFSRELLPKQFDRAFEKVKRQIANSEFISLSIDAWSSGTTHSVLGVIAHFLSPEFDPKFLVLAAKPIKGAHTGQELSNLIAKVLSDYEIGANKVHLILRDDESAMKLATRLAGFESQQCFAHRIQLAINDGLKLLDGFCETIERIKKAIRKIRKSRRSAEEFSLLQDEHGLPQTMLKKGIDVRWNSVYQMLNSFIENKEALVLMPATDNKFPRFSSVEWRMMSNLCKILQPIYKATLLVQNRKAGISGVLPLFNVLVKKMKTDNAGDDFPEVKNRIVESLVERMHGWEENKNLVMATMLDPHYKLSFFEEMNQCLFKDLLLREIEKMALHEIDKEADQTELPIEPVTFGDPHSPDPFQEYLETETELFSFASQSPSPTVADAKAKAAGQVTEYLNTPRFDSSSSAFWRNPLNAAKYSLFIPLVRKYHSAVMTTSECERFFSTATFTLDDRRKNLSVESLEKQLFLHHNLLIFNFDLD